MSATQQAFHLLRTLRDSDIELWVRNPLDRATLFESQESLHPQHVAFTTAAAKLLVEMDVLYLETETNNVAFDLLERPHLTGPHDLILVEKKHGDARRSDQLVDLRAVRSESRLGISIHRRLPDSMCLVEDEDIKTVAVGGHELIEVLEHLLNSWGAVSRHLAKGLGERPRARRMKDGPTPACEFTEKRQSDYAFAASRPAGHHDDPLGVSRTSLLDAVQHQVDRKLLVAEQVELGTVSYLVRGHLEKLL